MTERQRAELMLRAGLISRAQFDEAMERFKTLEPVE